MIKFDYLIRRDESDEIQEFSPSRIPKELPALVLIQGPNSSGKSTLLHVIALGLFGLQRQKGEELHTSLVQKLENLLNSEHQKLSFNFEIRNSGLVLSVSKAANDMQPKVRIREHGSDQPLTSELFKKRFRLIYDVPHDPLQRLPQMLNEVKNSQRFYGKKVEALKDKVAEFLREIANSRDVQSLERLRGEIENYKKEKDEKEALKQERERFSAFLLSRRLSGIENEIERLQEKLDLLKREAQKAEATKSHLSRKDEELISRISKGYSQASVSYESATELLPKLLPKLGKKYELWCIADYKKEAQDPNNYNNLHELGKQFVDLLAQESNKLEAQIQQANFLRSLRDLLNHYASSNVSMPGSDKSIKEIVLVLENELLALQKTKAKHENISACIEHIRQLLGKIDELSQLFKDSVRVSNEKIYFTEGLKEAANNDRGEVFSGRLQSRLEERKLVLEELERIGPESDLEKRITFYEAEIDGHTESQLKERYESVSEEISQLISERGRIARELEVRSAEYDKLSKQKPHKFQSYAGELTRVFEKAKALEQNLLVEMNDHLQMIGRSEKRAEVAGNPDMMSYAEKVGLYLAKKVRSIGYGESRFETKSIDIVRERITTVSGKIIGFQDMGTGQSQSAYLEGLLSASDNRMIIALFDEVAMMDTLSLEPIIKRLRELYKQNKLLLGIIVQKSDVLEVKSLV